MRAVILAAGQGTRLMPLTADRPKCLVPLFDIPVLQRLIGVMRGVGISDVTVIAGYRHDQIAAVASGCKIVLNPDYATTNMVATLFCARELFDEHGTDLIVSYGDIVYEPRVLAALASSDASISLAVNTGWLDLWSRRMVDPLADAETLKLTATGRILELGKKARSYEEIQGQYMGLFKVRADRLAAFRAGYDAMDRKTLYDGRPLATMYMTSFLQHLIDLDWQVQAVPVRGGWLEIDTVEDWQLYHRMKEDGTLGPIFEDAL